MSVSGRFAAQRSAFKPIFPIFVTFRNVLYVRVGKLIVRLRRRSARERSFEEASGETEVWKTPAGARATLPAAAGAGAADNITIERSR